MFKLLIITRYFAIYGDGGVAVTQTIVEFDHKIDADVAYQAVLDQKHPDGSRMTTTPMRLYMA